MHFFTLVSFALSASLAIAAPRKCGRIKAAYANKVVSQFTTDGIIPDLIEAPTLGTPKSRVQVAYGNKKVQLGTYFETLETLTAPTLKFTAEKNFDPATTKYTYFMVDPDVPQDGSPAQVNFLHWMVSNAQPQCIRNQNPTTVAEYFPLTPASTTQHRYTFLVYRQPPNFDIPALEVVLANVRSPFDLNSFAQDQGLVLVGGNFLKEAITNGIP